MCLYPKEEIKIAQEPILCIKIIGQEKKYLFGLFKFWRSPIYGISKNRKYKKKLIACRRLYMEFTINNRAIINTGFHLYSDTKNEEESYIFNYGNDLRPAIIPIGAEYCRGQHYDLVANKIIVFENEKQREKYLKR